MAALLTSHVFAFAAESHGSASMGAGALELPTKRLRTIPVPDLRLLNPEERKDLIALADLVWENETPHDWRGSYPGVHYRNLDQWLLARMGAPITVERLYADLAETCAVRLRLASDKDAKMRKSLKEDVQAIAATIAESVRPLLDGRRFPEAFADSSGTETKFVLPDRRTLHLSLQPLMDMAVLEVEDAHSGEVLLHDQFPRAVAQVFSRSILMGRREFSVPLDPSAAERALQKYFQWFPEVIARIEQGCQSTSLGTRFELDVRAAVLRSLGLHTALTESEIYGTFLVES